jgi:Protein of unknown function (DUF4231)
MTVSMGPSGKPSVPLPETALRELDQLMKWYATNARHSRGRHHVAEVALLVVGALIPVTACPPWQRRSCGVVGRHHRNPHWPTAGLPLA